MIGLSIPQPKAADIYYNACGRTDHRNHCRSKALQIENKLLTHNWSKRVNLSIFLIIVVDAWIMLKTCTYSKEIQKSCYTNVAEEIIDNTHEIIRTRSSRRLQEESEGSNASDAVVIKNGRVYSLHLLKKRRKRKGLVTKKSYNRFVEDIRRINPSASNLPVLIIIQIIGFVILIPIGITLQTILQKNILEFKDNIDNI